MASRAERLLDEIGWRIVAALQADARLSFSKLGRRVGLSAPAAAERVRRLEDAGIITGFRVGLALDKLGYAMTAIIRVSAPEENCVKLAALVRGLPGVVESHRVTGPDRLVLKVAVPSVAHLDEIIRELSNYGTATAAIVLSSRSSVVARPAGPTDSRSHPRTLVLKRREPP